MSVSAKIMAGLAAYKATRGLYEGGFAGAGLQIGAAVANKALAGSGTKLLNAFNVSGSYNYNSGFSGGVGMGLGGAGQEFERLAGVNVGLNYNDQTGFGASIGYQGDHFNLGVGVSGLGGHSSGTYGNIYGGLTSGSQGDYFRGSLDLNYNYRDNSFGGGVSVLQDFSSFGNNPSYFDRFSTALNWNSEAGFSNQIQYTLSNRGYDAINRNVMDPGTGFMQGMANNFTEMMYGVGSAVSGMWRDEGKEKQKSLDEFGYAVDKKTGKVLYLDSKGNTAITSMEEFLKILKSEFDEDDLTMVGDKIVKSKQTQLAEKWNKRNFKLVQKELKKRIGEGNASITDSLSSPEKSYLKRLITRLLDMPENLDDQMKSYYMKSYHKEYKDAISKTLTSKIENNPNLSLSDIESDIVNQLNRNKEDFSAEFDRLLSAGGLGWIGEGLGVMSVNGFFDGAYAAEEYNLLKNDRVNALTIMAQVASMGDLDPQTAIERFKDRTLYLEQTHNNKFWLDSLNRENKQHTIYGNLRDFELNYFLIQYNNYNKLKDIRSRKPIVTEKTIGIEAL